MDQQTKVKAMRQSGLPVSIESYIEFNQRWRTTYDKVLEKYHTTGSDNNVVMPKIQKILARYESLLRRQYKDIEEWDLITSTQEWIALIKQYGPMVVAVDSETQELVYVIADELMA